MPRGSTPCRNCGMPVPADRRVCSSCGTPVTVSEAVGAAGPRPSPEAIVDAGPADGITSGGIVPNPAVPGSYLSPSTVFQAPLVAAPRPTMMPLAGTAAPTSDGGSDERAAAEPAAPGAAGPTNAAPPTSAVPPTSAAPISGAAPISAGMSPVRPGNAPLLADLPFDAPNSAAGWLVALGSGVGSLSFLLPWAPRVVSYTSSWGLANPANLPILGLLIATAVLAILPSRVASWVRFGVLGMIGGSLFLGLLWPYIVGDFGAEFGSIIGAAAAIVLVVGGVLSVAQERNRPLAA
ncbi:MAG: hypothetical protein HYX54_09380 [Chloroflexi bacterium]|nr:hypothetical protein [Chloroflexota bacterium]